MTTKDWLFCVAIAAVSVCLFLITRPEFNAAPDLASSSITDWLGVGVSTAGIYFVVKTLRLQAKTADDQFKLLEIESRRAAREIKPVLEFVHVRSESVTRRNYSGYVKNHFLITCLTNRAVGLCVEISYHPVSGITQEGDIIFSTNAIDLTVSQKATLVIAGPESHKPEHYLKIHYLDEDRRAFSDDYLITLDKIVAIPKERIAKTEYPGHTIISNGSIQPSMAAIQKKS